LPPDVNEVIDVGGRQVVVDTIEPRVPKPGDAGEIHGHPLGTSAP
jgi:hypothetical protein